MADILIRGMEMPTEYRTEVLIFKNGFVAYYDVDGRYLGQAKATHLPEKHGRLIDANDLLEKVNSDDALNLHTVTIADLIREKVTTIVPAEGGADK